MNEELAGEVVAMARTENAPQVSVAEGGQIAASAHEAAAPASRVATGMPEKPGSAAAAKAALPWR